MEFKKFKAKQQNHVTSMMKEVNHLFIVDLDKDKMWELYLDSFPAGTNEIYRERREYDCSCCRHFIKAFGNVVSIVDNKVTTIWDFNADSTTFQPVIDALSKYVKNHTVSDVFISKEKAFGTDKNFEDDNGKAVTWDHFFIQVPDKFISKSRDTEASVMSQLRGVKDVFKRSLEEISEDSVLTILELISQNSLYKGEEWEAVLKQFLKYHKEYNKVKIKDQNNYCWEKSVIAGPVIGKIKNHSIGTLLSDVTEGTELNEAVRKYESIVAGSNYKRPKAIFTKKMLEDAQKTIEELGLLDSLGRRFATLDDITVNNILYANKDSAKRVIGSVFDDMAKELAVNPKTFDKVEEISIKDFVKNILPTAQNIEVMVENRHSGNLVSLIAPKVKDSKSMFKWDNGFSWAYKGNIADSMKERVKSLGGKVEGVLRFSIQWNDNGDNEDDLDAHCTEANGHEIYYANKGRVHPSSGMLDVDITQPKYQVVGGIAVENIIYSDLKKMPEDKYVFFVRCFRSAGAKSGFTAEIEFDGQVFAFSYNKPLRQSEDIIVAEVSYSKKDGFSIKEKLPSSASSRKMWGLDSNQFHPVSVVSMSPNWWDEQEGIGNKHYFFMLKNCVNDESPNGFYNEYLKEDLLAHRRVFEALGSKMRVEDVDDQLSGLGFSSTQRNSLVCKVTGHVNRTVKIIF